MPSIDWNKIFEKQFKSFKRENPENEVYYGQRWGDPNTSKNLISIRERFVTPFLDTEHTALEIGSGGGRWTQYLVNFKKLYCVDLNSCMFPYLSDRFGSYKNIYFIKTNGTDLPNIPENSVDYLFSFGTFEHLDTYLIKEYLLNFKKVLKPNANVVIHYSEKKKFTENDKKWLADNTAEEMRELVKQCGFSIISEDLTSLPASNIIHFT